MINYGNNKKISIGVNAVEKTPYLRPLKPWDEFDFENKFYTVTANGERVFVHNVRVDMHDVHTAAMCVVEFDEEVEIRIKRLKPISFVDIRPLDAEVSRSLEDDGTLVLKVGRSAHLSIEFDGDRFGNLHLFAEKRMPVPEGRQIPPGVHRGEDVTPAEGETIVFMPGLHYVEETVLRAASGCGIYLSYGAVLVGSVVCENVSDVKIYGHGIIDLHEFKRYSAFRGVKIVNSENITVEGIAIVNPPHYSVYLGKSRKIRIDGIKCFSCVGWSDGIDMMVCEDVSCENIFMRNSDDCVAIYASRWQHNGSTRNVSVKNSILWADVAHPMNIGIHGLDGDVIENVSFENITVLNHHEPQKNYMGVMAIMAGDGVLVRNVSYKNIRVEAIERGRLIDVRVLENRDYNSLPGIGIENVTFENISAPDCGEESVIEGFSEERQVKNVVLRNVSEKNIRVGRFADGVRSE
ncbi:MAG: glycosyl hydrolase family 28 protein [Clostridia bacterium]